MSSSSTLTSLRRRSLPRRSRNDMALSSRETEMSRPLGWCVDLARPNPHTVSVVALVANLVQELVQRRADTLELSGLDDRQIRIGDVPPFSGYLMLGDPVFHLRAAHPRPALLPREEHVQLIG